MTTVLSPRNEVAQEPARAWQNHWLVTYPITARENGLPIDCEPGDIVWTDGLFPTKAAAEQEAARLMLIPSCSGQRLFGGCLEYLGPEPA